MTVYEQFPTPLINRLEKHFVLYSSVLEDWQTDVMKELQQWIKDFSHVQSSSFRCKICCDFVTRDCSFCVFRESDAFVGYQKDVAAAVVFQASSQLGKTCKRIRREATSWPQLWEQSWEDCLLGDCSLDQLAQEQEGSDIWKKAVCEMHMSCTWQKIVPSCSQASVSETNRC